jgi:hypothetical protein
VEKPYRHFALSKWDKLICEIDLKKSFISSGQQASMKAFSYLIFNLNRFDCLVEGLK